ncbi:MAG TPA: tocopherol cyclase family protein [Coriobacteriia bacterium]
MPYRFTKLWTPGNYQDGRKALGYFEGWYYKAVDAAGRHPVAIIPGVSMPKGAPPVSFVQFIDSAGRTRFYEYPIDAFGFDKRRLDIRVGPNRFTEAGVSIDLDGPDGRVEGELSFSGWTPWPVTLLSPGIMGWYRFVPFMECYHGVLSMDHGIQGSLVVDGAVLYFTGGRGYVEKDWGRSFPSEWVWMQTNHFQGRLGTSLTLSVARIPWMGSSFVGVIAGLLVDGRIFRFATYTGATLEHLRYQPGGVEVRLRDRHHVLDVSAEGAVPGTLRSPVLGEMAGEVLEALDGTVHVRLAERDGTVVFDGEGRRTGIELMDPHERLATD